MGNGCWKQVYKIIKIIYKCTFIWIREYIICYDSVCMVSAVNVSGSGNTFLISSFSCCFFFLYIIFFYLNMNLTSSIYGYNVQKEIQFHALHIQMFLTFANYLKIMTLKLLELCRVQSRHELCIKSTILSNFNYLEICNLLKSGSSLKFNKY